MSNSGDPGYKIVQQPFSEKRMSDIVGVRIIVATVFGDTDHLDLKKIS